jgi:2-dehydro-3-deoxyphosphogluconate aldolase/(4S)-4-hydroxy-2-oxoglutarate aldolase
VTDGDVLFLLASMRAGSDAVKLFPVGSMGGAGYLRALREPLPGLRAVVSGGIAAGQAGTVTGEGSLVADVQRTGSADS